MVTIVLGWIRIRWGSACASWGVAGRGRVREAGPGTAPLASWHENGKRPPDRGHDDRAGSMALCASFSINTVLVPRSMRIACGAAVSAAAVSAGAVASIQAAIPQAAIPRVRSLVDLAVVIAIISVGAA